MPRAPAIINEAGQANVPDPYTETLREIGHEPPAPVEVAPLVKDGTMKVPDPYKEALEQGQDPVLDVFGRPKVPVKVDMIQEPPPEPEPPKPVDTKKAEEDQQATTVERNVQASIDKNPDEYAEVLRYSKQLGAPPDAIQSQLQQVRNSEKPKENDYHALAANTPGLARFLTNPDNAAIAHDDIPALSRVERGYRRGTKGLNERGASLLDAIVNPDPEAIKAAQVRPNVFDETKEGFYKSGRAFSISYHNMIAGTALAGVASGQLTPEQARDFIVENTKKAREKEESLGPRYQSFLAAQEKPGAKLDKAFRGAWKAIAPLIARFAYSEQANRMGFYGDDAEWIGRKEEARGEVLNQLKALTEGSGATVGAAVEYLPVIAKYPKESVLQAMSQFGYGVPSMALGAAGGYAGAPLGPVGVFSGGVAGAFSGGFVTELGMSLVEDMQKDGIDLTDPAQVDAILRDPKRLANYYERGVRKAAGTAGFDAIGMVVGGLAVHSAIRSASKTSIIKKVLGAVKGVGIEAGSEGLGEFTGQLAKEKGDIEKVSAAESFVEALMTPFNSIGHATVGAAIASSAEQSKKSEDRHSPDNPDNKPPSVDRRKEYHEDTVEAANEVVADTIKAHQDMDRAVGLVMAAQAIQDSKLAGRDEEKTLEMLKEVDGGEGTVYFQADAWDEYWTEQGLSPSQAYTQITGDREGYHRVRESTKELPIKVSDLMTRVGRDKARFDDLIRIMRFEQGGKTTMESVEFLKDVPGLFSTLSDEAKAKTEGATQEKGQPIEKPLAEGIKAANQDPEAAKLLREFIKVLATSEGKTPEELFNAFPLRTASDAGTEDTHDKSVYEQGDVIDARERFRSRQIEAGTISQNEPLKYPERKPLDGFLSRYGEGYDTERNAAVAAQKKKNGPYPVVKRIPTIGWAPNFEAEPTGVIGEPRIQEPNDLKSWRPTDPLKWADRKYEATLRLIRLHKERGIPLVINTSSDLIAADSYIEAMDPANTTINFYLTTGDGQTDRVLFPGNASRSRVEEAAKRLEERGFNVNRIEPTHRDIVDAAHGIGNVRKQLGSKDNIEASNIVSRSLKNRGLKVLEQSNLPADLDTKFKTATPEEFVSARDKNKRSAFLSQSGPEAISGHQLYLSEDGTVGFALSPEGDLQNVFNNSGRKGAGTDAILHAIQLGAKTLDCMAGYLPQYYSNFGFQLTNSVKWDDQYAPAGWDYEKYGRPDIVFMEYPESLSRDPGKVRARLDAARDFRSDRASSGEDQSGPLRISDQYGIIDWSAWREVGPRQQGDAPGSTGLDSGPVTLEQSKLPAISPTVSPLGFYSPLEKAILDMNMGKSVPASDLLNRIKNLPGIKAEELAVIGLPDFLAAISAEASVPFVVFHTSEGSVFRRERFASEEEARAAAEEYNGKVAQSQAIVEKWGGYSSLLSAAGKGDAQAQQDRLTYNNLSVSSDGKASVERDQFSGKVTKEQVLQFVRNKGLKVSQIVKGDAFSNENEPRLITRRTIEVTSDIPLVEDLSWSDLGVQDPDIDYISERADENLRENGRNMFEDLEEKQREFLIEYLDDNDIPYKKNEDGTASDEVVIEYHWSEGTRIKFIGGVEGLGFDTEGYYRANNDLTRKIVAKLDDWVHREYGSRAYDQEYDYYINHDEYADRKYRERETGYDLIGNDGSGYYYCPDNGKSYNASLEEAKIQLINDMVEDGLVEYQESRDERLAEEERQRLLEEGDQEDEQFTSEARYTGPIGPKPQNINQPTSAPKWRSYTIPGGTNYREILITLPDVLPDWKYSTHWGDQPGVLFHIRITDRIDASGKKVLMVEELQSDLMQQGRERGFKGDSVTALPEGFSVRQVEDDEIPFPLYQVFNENNEPFTGKYAEKSGAIHFALESLTKEATRNAVPDAPFKQTDAWAALALKRLITLAVQEGYDSIAWTPGDVHTNRWGTENIAWKKVEAQFQIGTTDGRFRPPDTVFSDEMSAYAAIDNLTGDVKEHAYVKELSPGFLVGSVGQVGGNAGGVDLEAEARNRGLQLERNGERVTSEEELRKVLSDTLGRERGARAVESLTKQIWKQMQTNPEGLRAPRREGFQFFYDDLLPNKVAPKVLKAIDKNAKVEKTHLSSVVGEENAKEAVGTAGVDTAFNIPITDEMKAKIQGGLALFQSQFGNVSPLGFYSKMARTIEEKMGNSASVEQINGMLREIKPEERKWSGIDDFLKGKDKVSKQELLDFLRANQLQVEEVRKTDSQKRAEFLAGLQVRSNYAGTGFIAYYEGAPIAEGGTIQEARHAAFNAMGYEEEYKEEASGTKYGGYSLPGGKNYREVLFTLPSDQSKEQEELRAEAERRGYPDKISDWPDQEFARTYREKVTNALPDPNDFRSKHWDETNVFAHVRLNDRIDADGKKVLFVEEVQSDWHKQGGKKGYIEKTKEDRAKLLKEGYDILKKVYPVNKLASKGILIGDTSDPASKRQDIISKLSEEDAKRLTEIEETVSKMDSLSMRQGVPDAPFRKTWHEFAFKRILIMAAEGGYDRVAWTTGEQQSDRYDLSTKVTSVMYEKTADGDYELTILDTGGNPISLPKDTYKPGELDEVIGKELADKIRAGEGKKRRSSNERFFEGVDLKVGGKGMKGFYDKIIPDFLRKFGKKYGATVGQTNIRTTAFGASSLGIMSASDGSWQIIDERGAVYRDEQGGRYENYETLQEAEEVRSTIEVGSDKTKVHSIDITPQLRDAAKQEGFSLFQKGGENRGSIEFLMNEAILRFGQTSDASTSIHEQGHYFLEFMSRYVATGKASERTKQILADTRRWWSDSAQDIITATEKAMTKEERPEKKAQLQALLNQIQERGGVEYVKSIASNWGQMAMSQEDQLMAIQLHEYFARAFEAYLMRGEVSNPKLKSLFAKFRNWLIQIYKRARNLNVNLSPEIRSVFDRLLSTDEQIADANHDMVKPPSAAVLGLSGDQAAAYDRAVSDAEEWAKARLDSKLMKSLLEKQEKQYKDARKRIKESVTKEVNNQPDQVALSVIRTGKMPNGDVVSDGGMKLNSALVKSELGEKELKSLPSGTTSKEGGSAPSDLAALFGFEDARALVEALSKAEPRDQLIERLTEQQIQLEHPDLQFSPELDNETREQLHNTKRAELLRLQLQHMAEKSMPTLKDAIKRVSARVPNDKKMRQIAKATIGKTQVQDLDVAGYARAERAAAKRAGIALAQGDFEAAFDAKRDELFNHYLWVEANEAKKMMEKSLKLFGKISREKPSSRRDHELVLSAQAVLANFGIGTKKEDWKTYLVMMSEYDEEAYGKVVSLVEPAVANAAPYKTITMDAFVDMDTAVKALWSLSSEKAKIDAKGKKISVEKALDEIIAQIDLHNFKERSTKLADVGTVSDKGSSLLLSYSSMIRITESWAEQIDLSPHGPIHDYIVDEVIQKESEYFIAQKKYREKVIKAIDSLAKELQKPGKLHSTELNETFTRGQLFMAIMNMGNESNFRKLLVGRKWGEVNDDGVLNRSRWDAFIERLIKEGELTKEYFDAAQAIWDIFEETKPMAQRAHKQMFGFHFGEIKVSPINTPFGIYRGGYFPVAYDIFASPEAAARAAKKELQTQDPTQFPSVGRGMTKARNEDYSAPINLDHNQITMALDSHLRFAILGPTVKQVARIIKSRRFSEKIATINQGWLENMLIPWLKKTGNQQLTEPVKGKLFSAIARMTTQIRTMHGYGVLALNAYNDIQNTTGASLIKAKVPEANLKKAALKYANNSEEVSAAIAQKSKYMESLMGQSALVLTQEFEKLMVPTTTVQKIKNANQEAMKWGFFFTELGQSYLNTIAWLAVYDQKISEGLDEKKAVKEADAAVRLTQGSSRASGLAEIFRSNAFVKLFIQFRSWANMRANLVYTEQYKKKKIAELKGEKVSYRDLSPIYFYGVVTILAINTLLGFAKRRRIDEEDDGGYADDVWSAAASNAFRDVSGSLPGLGLAIDLVPSVFTKSKHDDRLAIPVLAALESGVRVVPNAWQVLTQGKGSKKALAKDALTTFSILTGIPVAPFGRQAGYLIDVAEGKVKPTGPLDFGLGVVFGVGSESRKKKPRLR